MLHAIVLVVTKYFKQAQGKIHILSLIKLFQPCKIKGKEN